MPSSGNEEVRSGAPEGGDAGHRRGPVAPRPPSSGDAASSSVAGAVPATRRDAFMWVIFAGVGFVVAQIVALLAAEVAASITGNSARLTAIANLAAPPTWYIGSGLVGVWVGFFVGPLIASRARGTGHLARDLGIAFRPIDLLGIVIGAGGQLLVTLLYLPFVSHLHNFSAPTTKLTGGAHGFSFAVIAVMTIVGAPFFEELFFRGLLFRGLLGLFSPEGSPARPGRAGLFTVVAAVLVDGALFGLAHAELEQLAGLAVFGAILAWVAFKSGRLGMSMVAHGTFNLIAVIAVISSRSGVIH